MNVITFHFINPYHPSALFGLFCRDHLFSTSTSFRGFPSYTQQYQHLFDSHQTRNSLTHVHTCHFLPSHARHFRRQFPQLSHFEASTSILYGAGGTWQHRSALRVAGVAATALGWRWWRVWFPWVLQLFADRRGIWMHLVTSRVTWRGGALLALGWFWRACSLWAQSVCGTRAT